jgi:hypothetical protein
MFAGFRKTIPMMVCKFLLAATLSLLLADTAFSQNNQLRGLSQPGASRLPSARQQLNQTLNQQQSGFSTQRRIDSNNRLNRTNQINRLNSQNGTTLAPCPSANSACQSAR